MLLDVAAAPVREGPIIMGAKSVQRILAGAKTQTRRVVTPAPPAWVRSFGFSVFTPPRSISGRGTHPESGEGEEFVRAAYGLRGDRLYVRETWSPDHRNVYPCYPLVYQADRDAPTRDDYERHVPGCTFERNGERRADCLRCAGFRWRSPRFMPKKAARLWLELVDVRVERVQSISHEDAIDEGCTGHDPEPKDEGGTIYAWPGRSSAPDPRAEFAHGWDLLNARRGEAFTWAANPWVWVLQFKRIDAVV